MDIHALHSLASKQFSNRIQLDSLWQETAENFYPERADFTVRRNMGEDFASNLVSSYPIIARRELGNAFSSMLRPTGQEWFHMRPMYVENIDTESRRWLERAATVQRRAMYDRPANFTRATKEGDHDFAAFGQAVISTEVMESGLLYRCWHLRDVAWVEDSTGKICAVFRKYKMKASEIKETFPKSHHREINEMCKKDPFHEVDCMHFMCKANLYDGDWKTEWVSIHYDRANDQVMEAVGLHYNMYTIPRWQTVSGSQYAYSPATVAALPDARLIQSMTYTLLTAGELAVNPPMLGVEGALRSDVNLRAGSLTWIAQEYDERSGAALRPIEQDKSGLNLGLSMIADARMMIQEALFLNKLSLPQRAPEMTAYEVAQRVQDYIRNAMPLFEPVEMDYNASLCETTFSLLMRYGAFGSPYDMPEGLQGQEIQFHFESPLHEAIERNKGQKFIEGAQLLAQAHAIDPTAIHLVDVRKSFRGAMEAIGYPADWMRSESEVAEIDAQVARAQEAEKMMAMMQQGADVASKLAPIAEQGMPA